MERRDAPRRQSCRRTNFLLSLAENYVNPPCSEAAFVVNSEPHTRALPSVRVREANASCMLVYVRDGSQSSLGLRLKLSDYFQQKFVF